MFLCCGDALVDCFATSAEAGALRFEGRIGGSGLNVASGLARLGRRVAFLAKIGTDPAGRRIRAFLQDEGVDTSLVVASPRNSTLAMVEMEATGTPHYAFYAEGTADRSLEPSDVPATLPAAVRAIQLGSYTSVLEPAAASFAALVKRESARRFIAYDPNVRLTAEPDAEVWRQRVALLAGSVHLLKLSAEDAALLYPGRGLDTLAADWMQRGVRLVAITRGREGALAFTSGGCSAAVPAAAGEIVDTLGAGDSFQAALLAWLERHDALSAAEAGILESDALQAMLGFAARAAALTCSRRGADPPRLAELGPIA